MVMSVNYVVTQMSVGLRLQSVLLRSDFYPNMNFFRHILINISAPLPIQNFTKICPAVADLSHADTQTFSHSLHFMCANKMYLSQQMVQELNSMKKVK